MKLRNIRKMLCAVCALLVCNLLLVSIWVTADTWIPEGVTCRLRKGRDGISAQRFLRGQAEDVTAFIRQSGQLSGQGQEVSVSVGYILGDAQALLGAELIYGTWKTEPKDILISEPLAIQMFQKSNCLGSLVTVLGKAYSVSGVYRLKGGFMRELAEDGSEMVLLDLEEAQAMWPIETILLQGDPKTAGQSLSLLDESFEGKLKRDYRGDDHNNARKMLKQIPGIQVLLLSVWAVFVGAFRIVNAVRAFYCSTARNVAERKDRHRLFISIRIWSVAMAAALKLLVFDLYIPEGMFAEQSQILLLSPYMDGIIDFFQWYNDALPTLWYINLTCLSIAFASVLSIAALKNLMSVLMLLTNGGLLRTQANGAGAARFFAEEERQFER